MSIEQEAGDEHAGAPALRVLLADGEQLILGAMSGLLSLGDDLVVAEAAAGPEVLAMTLAHRPDVAVLVSRHGLRTV